MLGPRRLRGKYIGDPFHCEVESSVEDGFTVTTVHCHGRLINQTAGEVKDILKPLIPQGGIIVIDLGDVTFWIALVWERWLG
jgi:hypothetical protein